MIRLGRSGGIGPRFVARIRSPAASIRLSAASSPEALSGEITAIGRPRSVRTTSLPAFTARTALEKCWLASRKPILIGTVAAGDDALEHPARWRIELWALAACVSRVWLGREAVESR